MLIPRSTVPIRTTACLLCLRAVDAVHCSPWVWCQKCDFMKIQIEWNELTESYARTTKFIPFKILRSTTQYCTKAPAIGYVNKYCNSMSMFI